MILNLTQHVSTEGQRTDGVIDPLPERRPVIVELLTFNILPSRKEVRERACWLAAEAANWAEGLFGSAKGARVMIGGAPFLMRPLEEELEHLGMVPVYAFSERASTEVRTMDGKVRKVSSFWHMGFV